MTIRKLSPVPLAMVAFVIIAALALPRVARAVSIGEVVLQSRLGEPLRAQVGLTAGSDEHIEDSCLSLSAPDPRDGDTSGYLTSANLSFKTEGKRQYVTISTRKPFNDAFAKFRLQIKCSETGSVTKTLTILPDLSLTAAQAQITAPVVSAEAENPQAQPSSDARSIAPAAKQPGGQNKRIKIAEHPTRKAARPTRNRPPQPAQISSTQSHAPAFRLKLSGDLIDESRIGKVSPEERASLLAQQKLLDADDQTARFLALQHQVKQLQDELGDIKLQLAQLGVTPSSAPPAATISSVAATALATPSVAQSAPATAPNSNTRLSAAKPPVIQRDDPYLKNGLFAVSGLLLAILISWAILRYYTKIKSRGIIQSQQDSEPLLKPASVAVAPPPSPTFSQGQSYYEPIIDSAPKANTHEAAHPSPKIIIEEVDEDASMLEEAGLYAAHGRLDKAVEILQEIVKRHPSKTEAWPLLLSLYSSLGNATEFEKAAREFLRHHPDSPAWGGMQALGRTLDRDNPLYADNHGPIPSSPLLSDTAAKHRPIGEVLVEMGLLSRQDLRNCLNDFDPKKHGRFGGYLVARKAITLVQLDQALLQQQELKNADARSDDLPSLQDMENLLADFDPKRDGSVGEFLASRNAVTPEQISQLLSPQANQETAPPASTAEMPLADYSQELDFALETSSKPPVFDLEFEPATGEIKPLDFEVSPPTHFAPEELLPFPEINLDMLNDIPSDPKPDTK